MQVWLDVIATCTLGARRRSLPRHDHHPHPSLPRAAPAHLPPRTNPRIHPRLQNPIHADNCDERLRVIIDDGGDPILLVERRNGATVTTTRHPFNAVLRPAAYPHMLLDVLKDRAVLGDTRFYEASSVNLTDRRLRVNAHRLALNCDTDKGGDILMVMYVEEPGSAMDGSFRLMLRPSGGGARYVHPDAWSTEEITQSNAGTESADFGYLSAARGHPNVWKNVIGASAPHAISRCVGDAELVPAARVAVDARDVVVLDTHGADARALAARDEPSPHFCVKDALAADGDAPPASLAALQDLPAYIGSVTNPRPSVRAIFAEAGLHLGKPRVSASTRDALLGASPGKFLVLGSDKLHAVFVNTLHAVPYIVSNEDGASAPLRTTAANFEKLGCSDLALIRRITWKDPAAARAPKKKRRRRTKPVKSASEEE